MPDVVITEFMDETAIGDGLAGFDVAYDPDLVDKPDELRKLLAGARGLIVRNRTQVRTTLLDAGPGLRIVGRLGVGLDNIDQEACRARNIAVCPATGANDLSVAEYVIATAMLLLRGAYSATDDVVAGKWPRSRLMGREISGKRLGLVGYGSIARETARRAAALGMTISAYDPHLPAGHPAWSQPWGRVESQSLGDLLANTDVLSLHVPLTGETRNLIDAAALAALPPGAIVINAARGGVIEEGAVAAALKAGRLGGAALDVFDEEPLSANGGGIFDGCPNLILTPHVAGVTAESNIRVSRVVADAVATALKAG
jgi:(S)-sulfolactate dehydrogenase